MNDSEIQGRQPTTAAFLSEAQIEILLRGLPQFAEFFSQPEFLLIFRKSPRAVDPVYEIQMAWAWEDRLESVAWIWIDALEGSLLQLYWE